MIKCPFCLVSINKNREDVTEKIRRGKKGEMLGLEEFHCPSCKQVFNNLNCISTIKFCDAISLISIKTKEGEEVARMMTQAIGGVSR